MAEQLIAGPDGDLARKVGWDECDAYARSVNDDGQERVLVCNLSRHTPPGDATGDHYDEDLGVSWRYADDD